MAERIDTDVLIAGAGCAGLSLAVHLLESGPPDLRVVLVDPRTEHTPDRTWCFWNVQPHPFERCVRHRWSRWDVRTADGRHVAAAPSLAYQHLPADAFYREALRRIEASDRVELHRGVRVDRLEERADHVRAHTSEGELRSALAFDSRPPRLEGPPAEGEVRLLQHFRGWFVRTEAPAFDPDTCTLMDFDVPQDDGIHFVYVLPFDSCNALVEDTWFTEAPWSQERYEAELARYLDARLDGIAHRIVGREGGVLPMTTEPFDAGYGSRVQRIGLAGGLAKPSTGYAFLFIQRHARRLARSLAAGRPPRVPAVRPAWTRMLDRVFLWVLREQPERAPSLFLRLFRDAPDDSVVRFLCETSSLADDLRVMAALPGGRFTRAAWRSRHLWMRNE